MVNIGHILLKLVSAIFYQIFIFSSNDKPSQTMKNVFYFNSYFHSQDIQIFVTFSLPFDTFQTEKGEWKWNNLSYNNLACVNLKM